MASQSSGMQNSLLAAGADHRHLQDKQNAALRSPISRLLRLLGAANVEFLIHHFAKIISDWPIDSEAEV